jgi:TrmH family RNA methyltransferase
VSYGAPRTVTSLTNATVKAVRALHLRKEREETGLFLAEGLKIIIEALDQGRAPRVLMHSRDADHPLLDRA